MSAHARGVSSMLRVALHSAPGMGVILITGVEDLSVSVETREAGRAGALCSPPIAPIATGWVSGPVDSASSVIGIVRINRGASSCEPSTHLASVNLGDGRHVVRGREV